MGTFTQSHPGLKAAWQSVNIFVYCSDTYGCLHERRTWEPSDRPTTHRSRPPLPPPQLDSTVGTGKIRQEPAVQLKTIDQFWYLHDEEWRESVSLIQAKDLQKVYRVVTWWLIMEVLCFPGGSAFSGDYVVSWRFCLFFVVLLFFFFIPLWMEVDPEVQNIRNHRSMTNNVKNRCWGSYGQLNPSLTVTFPCLLSAYVWCLCPASPPPPLLWLVNDVPVDSLLPPVPSSSARCSQALKTPSVLQSQMTHATTPVRFGRGHLATSFPSAPLSPTVPSSPPSNPF